MRGKRDTKMSFMLIPKHFLLSGEPRDCSIDIQTDKVVHTGHTHGHIGLYIQIHVQIYRTTQLVLMN